MASGVAQEDRELAPDAVELAAEAAERARLRLAPGPLVPGSVVAHAELGERRLEIALGADAPPEFREALARLLEPEGHPVPLVAQEQADVLLDRVAVVERDVERRRVLRAVPEDRIAVRVHHSRVRALRPARRDRAHLARQVHVEGAVAEAAVEPADQPRQPVVRLDVIVRVVEVRFAEQAAPRLVRARVVRDVGAGPRERLRTGTAGTEDKDVHRAGVYSLPAARDGAPRAAGMSKDPTKTVQIRKIDKVAPDHRGRSVWLGKIEPVELELVSTTALEKI